MHAHYVLQVSSRCVVDAHKSSIMLVKFGEIWVYSYYITSYILLIIYLCRLYNMVIFPWA